MDPLTALILGGSFLAKEAVGDAAKRILGPSWDVVGARVRNRLFGSHVGPVVGEAAELLLEARHEPQPVPAQILMQLLEHASHEEDETLHQKWVALLANAASPTAANKILPSYVDTLRQITPKQAEMLDWMHKQSQPPVWADGGRRWPDFKRDDLEQRFGLSPADYALLFTDLERLGLIEPRRPLHRLGSQDVETQVAIISEWINDRVQYAEISFTALGIRFVEACEPPAPMSP